MMSNNKSALLREIAKREGVKIKDTGVGARECVIFYGCYKELGEPLPAALLRGVVSKRRLKKAGMSKELLRDF